MRQTFAQRTDDLTIGVKIIGINQAASGSGHSLGDSLNKWHEQFRRTIGRTGTEVEDRRIPTDLLKLTGIRRIQIYRLDAGNCRSSGSRGQAHRTSLVDQASDDRKAQGTAPEDDMPTTIQTG
jgi:hypothetical protein